MQEPRMHSGAPGAVTFGCTSEPMGRSLVQRAALVVVWAVALALVVAVVFVAAAMRLVRTGGPIGDPRAGRDELAVDVDVVEDCQAYPGGVTCRRGIGALVEDDRDALDLGAGAGRT